MECHAQRRETEMRRALFLLLCTVLMGQTSFAEQPANSAPALAGRVVAAGIHGASAVSPVGTFHPGGPIRDKPEFAAFTQPGRILEAKRVLVTSTSNYWAPLAPPEAPGGPGL